MIRAIISDLKIVNKFHWHTKLLFKICAFQINRVFKVNSTGLNQSIFVRNFVDIHSDFNMSLDKEDEQRLELLKKHIGDFPDFPKAGILFK